MSSARDRAFLILVLLVSLFIVGGCGSQGGDNASPPQPPPVAPPPNAGSPRWTVLVYMVADNNLESAAIEDMNEMLDIPSTARVNVVVQADRGTPADGNSNEAVGGIPDWTSTKRLLVNHGSLTELADLGELNMGSPLVLEDFLVWGTTHFPAEKYAVVFWDHGSSWPGFGQDETDGNDVLSLAELKQALTDARLPRFDLIGFDSCLMANLEVASVLRSFGKVLVASEEIEPGHGWDYAAILGGLAANTAMSESDLGRLISDSYKAHAEAYGQNARTQGEAYNQERAVTLSVIDLSRVALLMETLDEFATTLHGKIGVESLISRPTWLGVAQARATSEEYGVDPKGGVTNDVTDLASFVDRVKQQVLDPTVLLQADSVLATLRGAMIYAINGADRPHAAGLSVYFPSRQDLNPDYLASSLSPTWESLLTSFNDLRVTDVTGPVLTGATVVGTDTDGHAVIGATVAGDDVDTVQAFVIQQAGSQIILLGSVDVPVSSGVAAVTWDGRWPRLCSDDTCQFAPFETIDDLEGNGVLLNIPAVYRPAGSTRGREVNLLFEYDTVQQTGTFLGAWPGSDTGLATKEVIALKTGDTITPYFETYDVLTDQPGFQLGAPLVITLQGVTLADAPLPTNETFLIGFTATDTSGNEAVTDTLVSCVGTVCQSGGSVANVWTTRTSMPTPGWCLASASVNGKIYVVNWGGGALTEYDPVTDRWTSMTPMPVSAMCSRAEAVNDKMYVMGGHNTSSQTFQTVMAYDPLTDSWSNKAPMQRPRTEFASAVIDGKIYVMGGVSGNQITNSVEVYDPVADTWTSKAPMATARVDFSASAVNGKIYAVSGDGSPCAVSTVEEYDPSSDHWTSRSPLPTARCGLATSAVNGKLYAIGGYGSAPPAFSTVEEYDPVTNHWTSKASMPTARAQLTAAEIGGRIYAVGGTMDLLPRGVATVEEFRP